MRIKGHPVHLMLIHFPSALFPLDLLGSIGGTYYFRPELLLMANYLMVIGVTAGVIAALFGFLDFLRLRKKPESELAVTQALIHGSIQLMVWMGYLVLSVRFIKGYPEVATPTNWLLLIKLLLVSGLVVANFYGAEVLLKSERKMD